MVADGDEDECAICRESGGDCYVGLVCRTEPGEFYIQSCGHPVHKECHDAYMLSTARTLAQMRFINPSEPDPRAGEFKCPMCGRLANCILPRPSLASRPLVLRTTCMLLVDCFRDMGSTKPPGEQAAEAMGRHLSGMCVTQPENASTIRVAHMNLVCTTRHTLSCTVQHPHCRHNTTRCQYIRSVQNTAMSRCLNEYIVACECE